MIKNGLLLILCFRRIGNIKVGSIRYKSIYSIQYTHKDIAKLGKRYRLREGSYRRKDIRILFIPLLS